MEGRGQMIWFKGTPEQIKYEGYWEKGKREGRGRLTEPNGLIYAGVWKNDKKHGLLECIQ